MTVSISNPAQMINLALARIGYRGRVGSLFEGSEAAKKALDIYAQTRDATLRSREWSFAARNVSGTLLKQAPPNGYVPPNTWNNTYPLLPWLYEYAYPDDALRIRTVKLTPIHIPNFDPQPQLFDIDNDQSYTPSQKVLLCNIPNAVIIYTAQITDPQAWEADFIEAFAAALGRRLAPVLMGIEATKLAAADEQTELSSANTSDQE